MDKLLYIEFLYNTFLEDEKIIIITQVIYKDMKQFLFHFLKN